MLYAINTVLLYKNGHLLYAITCFLGAICYKKQGVAAICYNHFWAFAICYILLNGLCYMLLHTPWGALYMPGGGTSTIYWWGGGSPGAVKTYPNSADKPP